MNDFDWMSNCTSLVVALETMHISRCLQMAGPSISWTFSSLICQRGLQGRREDKEPLTWEDEKDNVCNTSPQPVGTYRAQNSGYSGCHPVLIVQQLYQGVLLTIYHFSKMKKILQFTISGTGINTYFMITKIWAGLVIILKSMGELLILIYILFFQYLIVKFCQFSIFWKLILCIIKIMFSRPVKENNGVW